MMVKSSVTNIARENALLEELADSVAELRAVRYRFQGRERSAATGLANFRMRWYDAVTGRWLSKDPIGLSGGLNLYAFCGNGPVNNRDVWGECPSSDFMEIAGAFCEGFGSGLINGLAATADGMIPFFDPFSDVYSDDGDYLVSRYSGIVSLCSFVGAGGAKILGFSPWLGTFGLHNPHHGMGKHFEIIIRSLHDNKCIIIPGKNGPIYIGPQK